MQPLRQGINSISQLQESRERKTCLHLHPLKDNEKFDGNLKHRVN